MFVIPSGSEESLYTLWAVVAPLRPGQALRPLRSGPALRPGPLPRRSTQAHTPKALGGTNRFSARLLPQPDFPIPRPAADAHFSRGTPAAGAYNLEKTAFIGYTNL